MKQLLEDIFYTLNQLPNRKVKGKDFTTYELASRLEKEMDEIEVHLKLLTVALALIEHTKVDNNETIS